MKPLFTRNPLTKPFDCNRYGISELQEGAASVCGCEAAAAAVIDSRQNQSVFVGSLSVECKESHYLIH